MKNYSKSGRQSGKTKWKRGVRHGWSEFKSFDRYIWTKISMSMENFQSGNFF